ncbi:MAG: hypothetical protein IT578_05545 [Verrucomicrobiae bacterium]|nr:hypothetical protein [Verrucomicrobiae bacterium]
MKWFAIESSSPRVSLAFGEGDAVEREVAAEGEASRLIERLFRELAPDLDAVQACLLGRGPGSYNGLRVGYAFLKGLFCLRPVPVAELPTPLLLARQVAAARLSGAGRILVVNHARRGELYGAWVRASQESLAVEWEFTGVESDLRTRYDSTPEAVVTWDFAPASLSRLGGMPVYREFPRAGGMAAAARQAGISFSADLSRLEPAYVRPPVAVGFARQRS